MNEEKKEKKKKLSGVLGWVWGKKKTPLYTTTKVRLLRLVGTV